MSLRIAVIRLLCILSMCIMHSILILIPRIIHVTCSTRSMISVLIVIIVLMVSMTRVTVNCKINAVGNMAMVVLICMSVRRITLCLRP